MTGVRTPAALLTGRDRAPAPSRATPRPAHLAAAAAGGLLLGLLLTEAGARVGPAGVLVLVVAGLALPLVVGRPDLVVVGFAAALAVGSVPLGPVETVQLATFLTVAAVLGPATMRLGVRLPRWPVLAPMVAFVLLAVVSSAAAPVPALALNLIVQLVLLVLLTVAATTALRTPAQVQRAALALVVAGGLVAAYAVVTAGPTETYYAGGVVTGRAVGPFTQPNELGIVCAALLVLAVGVGLTRPGWPTRAVCGVAGTLLLAALGLSLSRGAWVGAVGGLVVLAVVCRPARKPLASLAALAVVVVAGLAALGVGFATGVVGRLASVGGSADNPYDQRGLIYTTALRLIDERPLTGHGPGGYTLPAASEALRDGAFLEVEHAHDLVLNVGVEFGLLGVAALLALMTGLVASAVSAHRRLADHEDLHDAHPGVRDQRERHAATALPGIVSAALVAVLIHTIVDYPLRNATCITVVWLLVSLVAVLDRVTSERPPPLPERNRG